MSAADSTGRNNARPGTDSHPEPPSLVAARTVVRALIHAGVHQVILAPGSRSAPLVPALAAAERDGKLRVRVVLDERSAGFVALGCARAELLAGRRRPAAVVTTSGTAVANLHPAVAEADAAGVPLLLVTADRPHEAVGTGANQTTEQTRIFGAAARLTVDLPADITADLGQAGVRAVAGQVRRAVDAATGALTNDPGPAQLNLRFRPPLAPEPGAETPAGTGTAPGVAPPTQVGLPETSGGPAAPIAPVPAAPQRPGAAEQPRQNAGNGCREEHGVVVAGDAVDATGRYARALAEYLDWPLLAEPTSGARGGPQALTRYAELLNTRAGARLAAQVERVVVAGHPSLTRPIGALLGRDDLRIDVLTGTSRWTDVAGTAASVVPLMPAAHRNAPAGTAAPSAPADLADALDLGQGPHGWTARWHAAVAALPADPDPARADILSADAAVTAVWDAALRAPVGAAPLLVVGSSLTIRRLDRLAAPARGPAPAAIANRGLAGIDGTLATSLGAAITAGPVRVVVGDLTFLHDAMSLSRGSLEAEPDLQVIVIDDGGGAIFSTLEYPAVTPPADLARFFTTPQATDPAALAAALGLRVHRPPGLAALRALLDQPVHGLSLVHVRLAAEAGDNNST
ncbi:2-succinyl-5-enolpyruvyl-6-hydroxy-3-cyclohexene-1-carboxylic-acid synthase [Actinomyces glycerinitolerans]|uniref:2-succinyl-5-enolpyruvyl-6-hydroxy-3-cyclohexene-1-carboxylate synthase n=1 Tax=Actinomyces glycerinitolerans TaxID=1892869 RepID=A0A1M4S0I8_9ACTO|nr:2-succinyl-5-enolpyruvyl-6-hydroxy-3-cyclohexene-1-carboxylic-acid synthase [Actinomyces glycerinitolerans]SHE25679.1 menaquinone biosynthesis protein mend [Actinomyces glycerinitolerans]